MPNVALIPAAATRVSLLTAVVDGFPETTHALKLDKSDEPLEDGTSVTDHAVTLPEGLVLTGWVSDIRGGSRPGRAWDEIRRLNRAKTPLTVVTEWGTYTQDVDGGGRGDLGWPGPSVHHAHQGDRARRQPAAIAAGGNRHRARGRPHRINRPRPRGLHMTLLYDRRIKVQVAGLTVEDLRVALEIEREADATQNTGTVSIFNLAPENEERVYKRADEIRVSAGYPETIALIYDGHVERVQRNARAACAENRDQARRHGAALRPGEPQARRHLLGDAGGTRPDSRDRPRHREGDGACRSDRSTPSPKTRPGRIGRSPARRRPR